MLARELLLESSHRMDRMETLSAQATWVDARLGLIAM